MINKKKKYVPSGVSHKIYYGDGHQSSRFENVEAHVQEILHHL